MVQCGSAQQWPKEEDKPRAQELKEETIKDVKEDFLADEHVGAAQDFTGTGKNSSAPRQLLCAGDQASVVSNSNHASTGKLHFSIEKYKISLMCIIVKPVFDEQMVFWHKGIEHKPTLLFSILGIINFSRIKSTMSIFLFSQLLLFVFLFW